MNKCFLIGRLTRDPEISTTASGLTVAKFSIAVNRQFSNANGEKEVDFLNIVAWRALADNCAKYIFKGSKVAVSGTIQIRAYEDKNNKKCYATDIIADSIEFLDAKSSEPDTTPKKKTTAELKPMEDSGLPF